MTYMTIVELLDEA